MNCIDLDLEVVYRTPAVFNLIYPAKARQLRRQKIVVMTQ